MPTDDIRSGQPVFAPEEEGAAPFASVDAALAQAALVQLAEGVIVAGSSGRITFVNEAAARLHGVRRLEVTPGEYAEAYRLFTEDGRPYPSTELPLARAALRGETVTEARWRIRRPDGSEVLAVGSARPVLDDDGVQIGAVLTLRDDGAREVARAAIRERDAIAEQLREAFEQSPVSTLVYDAEGRPVAANPAFERLWGAGMADVPEGYSALTDPQLEAAGVLPLLRRAFGLDGARGPDGAGEAVTLPALRYDVKHTAGRGNTLWTQAHAYPVRDANGAVERVVLTHEDVTARLSADAALREAVGRLRLALDSTGLGTWDLDTTTGALHWDARTKRAFGLAPDARIETYEDFVANVHPGDRERTARLVAEATTPAGSGAYDATFRAAVPREGGERWVRARGQAIFAGEGDERRVTRFLGTALDVTADRMAAAERERLLAATEVARAEAERANRAKSEFLAVMSHELRTPLNAIDGYAELMELGIRGPVTAQQREDLARIRTSQRHLLGLINGVLNYSRIEAGAVRYAVESVPLGETLATCEALTAPQARARAIELATGDCDPGLCARGDREKVQQIVLNLLSNAVKFTERGGRVRLTCEVHDDRIAIVVADTGRGIPADRLEQVFEPFVQVDASRTRTQEGVGLGLSIARDLARGMGGDLTAESEIGAGSTFTLTLPKG